MSRGRRLSTQKPAGLHVEQAGAHELIFGNGSVFWVTEEDVQASLLGSDDFNETPREEKPLPLLQRFWQYLSAVLLDSGENMPASAGQR